MVERVRRQRRELVVPDVEGEVGDALQPREQAGRELGQLRAVDLRRRRSTLVQFIALPLPLPLGVACLD